jgi:hypothetical protein
MQSSNPITIDNEVYPLYSANLAISSKYSEGQFEANAAMRLVPTRLDEQGNSITAEEHAKSVLVGTTKEISGPEQEAMQEIYQAVQKFLIAKGL